MTTTHHVTITEHDAIVTDDDRIAYRAVCSGCRWSGWAVFDRDAAVRQRDRHLEQAEIDGRTLAGPFDSAQGEPPCTP